jgi:hypothetical protein
MDGGGNYRFQQCLTERVGLLQRKREAMTAEGLCSTEDPCEIQSEEEFEWQA